MSDLHCAPPGLQLQSLHLLPAATTARKASYRSGLRPFAVDGAIESHQALTSDTQQLSCESRGLRCKRYPWPGRMRVSKSYLVQEKRHLSGVEDYRVGASAESGGRHQRPRGTFRGGAAAPVRGPGGSDHGVVGCAAGAWPVAGLGPGCGAGAVGGGDLSGGDRDGGHRGAR